jgi:hypothetical protein
MAGSKIKWHWVAGGISVVVFVVLLAVRLDIFNRGQNFFGPPGDGLVSSGVQSFQDRESWMNISQNGQKIGYARRLFSRTDSGYHITESVFMRINTMGIVQGMTFKTEGKLNRDMTLSSFDFNLRSSLFRFEVKGVVEGRKVTLYTEMPGAEKKTVISLKETPRLASGILESAGIGSMKKGDSKTFHVFDPTAMAQRSVKVTVMGDETVLTMGRERKARKVSVDFMGAKQFAWIGEDGDVLKEKGILGITLERVTKHEAMSDFAYSSSTDLTEMASVASDVVIDDPSSLTFLRVKITGMEKDALNLDGDRQIFRNNILYIQKETIPTRPLKEINTAAQNDFLKPGPFIQSDHPKIQEKVKEIIFHHIPSVAEATAHRGF